MGNFFSPSALLPDANLDITRTYWFLFLRRLLLFCYELHSESGPFAAHGSKISAGYLSPRLPFS